MNTERIKLNHLPLIDTSIRLSRKIDELNYHHYIFPFYVSTAAFDYNSLVRRKLAEILKTDQIEITLPSYPKFEIQDITHLASPEIQALLNPRNHQSVLQYLEETYVQPTVKAKITRFLKKAFLKAVGPLLLKNSRWLLPGSSKLAFLYQTWMAEVYTRYVSRPVPVVVKATEDQLPNAVGRISNTVWELRNHLKGSLNGISAIPLANTIGDGKTRFVVTAYLHTDALTSDLIHEAVRNQSKTTKNLYLTTESAATFMDLESPKPNITETRFRLELGSNGTDPVLKQVPEKEKSS